MRIFLDTNVLASAIATRGQGRRFFTGDKELLKLGRLEGIPIISPRELCQRLTGTSG